MKCSVPLGRRISASSLMISLAAAATVGYFSASSARYRSCSGERDVVGMAGSFLAN